MPLNKNLKVYIFIGLLVSLILAIVVSPFASSWPDGLERVAEDKGFIEKGEGPQAWTLSPIPDYAIPGLGESGLATAAAGLIGTLVVFGVGWGLAYVLRSRSNDIEEVGKEKKL